MVKGATHPKQWSERVAELNSKGMLTADQKETLGKMITSPDKENFILAQEILKAKMSEKLIEGLNEDQTIAFAEILEFFTDTQEDAFVLKGYAGTGKTYLVKRIIEYITASYPARRIAVTAPTNKAVQVLQANAPYNSKSSTSLVFEDLFNSASQMEYMTIHKLLGLKEQITASGQQLFKADGKNKSEITKFKYLIVDEVSMLDDHLCNEILKHSSDLKILFMGDPAQIPPVNKEDCIPFHEDHDYSFRRAELTEIMRQKGDHPVVDASFLLRNNLQVNQPIPVLETNLNDAGHGIEYYNSETDRKMIRPLLNQYFNCDAFRENADHAKVIAWRNKTVDYMNSIIRELMYGEDIEPYVVGEKLIARKPIFELKTGGRYPQWQIQFNTSEEMEVEEVKILTKRKFEGQYNMQMKVYQLKVKGYDAVNRIHFKNYISVIHPDSAAEYKALLKQAKDRAIEMREAKRWVTYFNILKWTADVAYNYAITCHKAQGSTYKNVFLMEEDIDLNRKTRERNRIKYTAYSRPTDKLFILRKNYQQ